MTAVLSGLKWGSSVQGTSGGTVTWSIAGAGLDISRFGQGAQSEDPDPSFDFDFEQEISDAFAEWSAAGNIDFVQVRDQGGSAGTGDTGEIRIFFDAIPGNTIGIAFFPSRFSDVGGDILIDTAVTNPTTFFQVLLHEIGHSIGFEHTDGDSILRPTIGAITNLTEEDIEGAELLYGPQDGEVAAYQLDGGQRNLEILETRDGLEVIGNSAANELIGSEADETLNGGGGNDMLAGGGGRNVLIGGNGNDELVGSGQRETFDGGAGIDTVDLSNRAQAVLADLQRDAPTFGGGLNDIYRDVEHLIGTGRDDSLRGSEADNTLRGGTGDDTLIGRNGNDVLIDGAGDDRVFGNSGADVFIGSAGADVLFGGFGIDTVNFDGSSGGVLADLINFVDGEGDAAGDIYRDIENVIGSDNVDDLRGTHGANNINGGAGDDLLFGRDGNDNLIGGDGNDRLIGNEGRDVLEGGGGADRFIFAANGDTTASSGRDLIRDFETGSDLLLFNALDADTTTGGNQSFEFIGDSRFSGEAGELAAIQFTRGGVTLVRADTDGDARPDIGVVLTGLLDLDRSDFIL